jgi:EAL domain-containing protein (putative c-di-GMP-specific phosphodiesterase class I)
MSLLNKGEYAARNGADNFYVLLGKDTTDAFIGAINPLAINADGELTINVYSRFGIFSIDDTTDIKESVSSALLAMNQARILKQTDIVWYNESSKQDMLHSMEIIAAFDDALKNDEFQVYYQPKVDLFKNRMCGAEALVRWIRDGRIMPPDEFIPVLEKENLITRLDFYVLTRVCMDLRGWLDAGLDPVTISSNFSKEHLSNPRFAEDVLEVLEHYFIPHDLIQAELTESSGYEDYNALNTFVSKMRDEGISTAMDDFGTGYSSLSLLRDINMDVIKLDRSFLRNIDMDDVKDEKMIANIVKMLHDLDKRVICEGIETEKQANYLRSINCHEAQGYLYGKPMPKKEFEKLSKLSRF